MYQFFSFCYSFSVIYQQMTFHSKISNNSKTLQIFILCKNLYFLAIISHYFNLTLSFNPNKKGRRKKLENLYATTRATAMLFHYMCFSYFRDLRSNKIDIIPDDSFHGLKKLQNL